MSRTQYRRINGCGLKQYFDYIFVSEDAGHQKPEVEYFDYVMANTPEKDKSKILVIGDSQSSDILGGINYNIKTIWFNKNNETCPDNVKPTYIVRALTEIEDII